MRTFYHLSPAKIAVGYLVFGVVWIGTTDRLLVSLVDSQRQIAQLQTIKGWVFVGLSAALIFGLSRIQRLQMTNVNRRLERANQQLHVLHRIFRHNVRNDLNIILGYAELLAERARGTGPQAEAHIETIRRTTDQLIEISEKLKIVDSMGSTADEKVVDLALLIEREVDCIRTAHPEVTISMTIPDSATIVAGRSVSHAIREVLKNSVDHHPNIDGCVVDIIVGKTHDAIHLDITDNGPGIPEHELDAVHRHDETPLDHPSSIGLWFVDWVCRIHDATVHFSRPPSGGTTVSFQFRRAGYRNLVPTEPVSFG